MPLNEPLVVSFYSVASTLLVSLCKVTTALWFCALKPFLASRFFLIFFFFLALPAFLRSFTPLLALVSSLIAEMLSSRAAYATCHILMMFSFIFDSLLVMLYFLSLGLMGPGTQSGGIFEAFPVALLVIACLVFVIYALYQFYRNYRYQGAKASKRALLIVFSSTFLLASIASIVITIRASQDGGTRLCADFSAAQFSCTTGFSIVVLSWLTTLIASVGFIVCYMGLRVITVTARHPGPIGLDPVSRPTTIGSFVQRAPGDPVPPKSAFWTMHVGTGKNQPKDLFQQSLPHSAEQTYRQERNVPV